MACDLTLNDQGDLNIINDKQPSDASEPNSVVEIKMSNNSRVNSLLQYHDGTQPQHFLQA